MGIPFCFGCIYYWDNHKTMVNFDESLLMSLPNLGLFMCPVALVSQMSSPTALEYLHSSTVGVAIAAIANLLIC